MNQQWDLWFPNAAATGLSFARCRVAADAASGRVLVRDGATIHLQDHWPTHHDLGTLVLLPGGEAGILTSWWHTPDHTQWRWTLELSNHQAAPEAHVAGAAVGR